MNRILTASAVILTLGACTTINTKIVDPLITTLAKINATATADLLIAQNAAKAATPPDLDGYNCAGAVITVSGQIKQVIDAAHATPGAAGVFTTAEIASLFQPGSAQFNQAQNTLASGCIAKANDVAGPAGVAIGGGVVGMLNAGKLLPLAAGL